MKILINEEVIMKNKHIIGKVLDNLHTCGSMFIVYNIPRKSAII